MAYISKNPRAVTRTVGGEAVAVLADEAVLHNLNETGTYIWDRADGRTTTESIAQGLSERYEVSLDEARGDVSAFCEHLVQLRLLRLTDEPLDSA